MSTFHTIEPAIQETILDILPNDYTTAMELMCQLLANMILSGNTPWTIDQAVSSIRKHLASYEGT